MTRGNPSGLRGPRARWWIIGVTVFLVVDVALVWWALSATGRSGRVAADPLPLTSFAPAPTVKPATATATPSATPSPRPTVVPLTLETYARRLVPIDGSLAWRVGTVACTGPLAIESSSDGGATWTSWSTGEDVWGVREIVGYTGDSSMVGIIASVAGDCHPEYRMSFTGGEFWGPYPEEQPDLAVIDPADPSVIEDAAGAVASPCGAVSEFAEGPAGVGLLCTSTDVRLAPPDFGSWTTVTIEGAPVAITTSGDGYLVASRRDPACPDGLRLSSVGGDASVVPGMCLAAYADETAPVTLATAPDGAIWLWVGDRVGVSEDGGSSWTGLG